MKKLVQLIQLILFSVILQNQGLQAQYTLEGKVTEQSGECLIAANIEVFREGVFITGTDTDFDGNFVVSGLEAGTYDIQISYVGYTTQKINGVVIKPYKANKLNVVLSEGNVLSEVIVIGYKVPLVKQDNTTQGKTITAENIRSLATKNIQGIAATSAGLSSSSNSGISVKGSRTSEINYYVDGIRVTGNSALIVQSEIKSFDNSEKQKKTQTLKTPCNESYAMIVENKPASPFISPLSTFSIDVDKAAYSNIRRIVNYGNLPDPDAVRIEEMINYFDYNYDLPKKEEVFAIHTELAECPWNRENQILRIGLQGAEISPEDLPPSNLVFLIDVSGSMSSENKLPLVKKSFLMLLEKLRPQDQVAIVTYAGRSQIALPSTSASEKPKIKEAIDNLYSGGSTAGAQGILTAYKIAKENYMKKGNNRVILATDGDFNVGISDNGSLEDLIVSKRKEGVFLSVLGYGMGNYKDDKLQLLADKGNGNHAYIDSEKEAKKTLVEEFGGTLYTIAKDVKIQIEFNPAYVAEYRLIGYENRMLATEDFIDDTKDAGELGSGHSVTALYEITPQIENISANTSDKLKYQKKRKLDFNKEIASIKFRYKKPKGKKSNLLKHKVYLSDKRLVTSEAMSHAMSVAEFGLVLRNSIYRGEASIIHARDLIKSLSTEEAKEFKTLLDETIRISEVQ